MDTAHSATQLTPHFAINEVVCPCGCGFAAMERRFLERLEALRLIYGRAIRVTSGFRCPVGNAAAFGRPNSPHLRGWAADLAADDARARHDLVAAAARVGFNRLGIANTFVHVDCDPSLDPDVIWLY